MKKFFLLAAAAVMVLASCSKNDQPEVSQDKSISFKSYAGRSVTKAGESFIPKGQTYLNSGDSFGVYAYNTGATPFAGSVENAKTFMTNQEVTFNGASATDAMNYEKYTYSPKKYWPNDEANNLLTFWAYYPYNALKAGFGAANAFEAKTNPEEMVDLLVADVNEDMTYTKAKGKGNVGIVPFTFHHALTMVKFVVKVASEEGSNVVLPEIKLNSMKITGATATGQITTSWASGATTFEWTPGDDATEFVLCKAPTALSTDDMYFPVNDATKASFLMIPQDLEGVKAVIEYEVANGDDDPVVNKVEVELATDAVAEWVMNKNIKYTFTIGLKPIEFTAVVDTWEDEVPVTISITD